MRTNAGVSHIGVSQSTVSSNTQILLQIVRVPVKGTKGVSGVIVLFDTGADRTYVTESLVGRIGPEWVGTCTISCAAFGRNSPGEATVRNVYEFCLQGDDHSLHVQTAEIPSICAALHRPSVPDSVLSPMGEGHHFVGAVEGEVKVDMLVSQDFLLETDDPWSGCSTFYLWLGNVWLVARGPQWSQSTKECLCFSSAVVLWCLWINGMQVLGFIECWDCRPLVTFGRSGDEGFMREGSVCRWSIFCGSAMERWVS